MLGRIINISGGQVNLPYVGVTLENGDEHVITRIPDPYRLFDRINPVATEIAGGFLEFRDENDNVITTVAEIEEWLVRVCKLYDRASTDIQPFVIARSCAGLLLSRGGGFIRPR